MEDYAAKMAGKTDAELNLYVERRAEYRDDAVLAALTELERRGQTIPGAAALRTELETAIRQAPVAAPVAPPWARPAAEEEEEEPAEDVPALYSRSAIALFSVVFFFVVGAVLMLLNLLRLRRYGGAALLMAVVTCLVSAQAYLPAVLGINPYYVGTSINIVAALIYIFALWPYFIGPQPYQPRGWLVPFLISFGVCLLILRLAGFSPPVTP
ncbi:hypothetical protein EJV47_03320 [Hymenobacter gummosus]|uniref:Uncharacterized protein n=1 Tax=Hymenobacter gummosus TaxID=1776032 RepID=A0A3S0HAU0_9BACT|nr:hypothetical protein [Hymenobacter gummosus]RTQ53778.1 hypothetical protein EJV47_03320 [Hymenobacter gummosus]